MNRFRSRRKAKDVLEGHVDADAPPIPLFTAPFKKGKKRVEPKESVDLSNVLPSSDEFRTSLLMPNLSARFSMLREQDDPKSKLGKANDDSVLFPRRTSRLDLFGHANTNQLADIAEVSSLAGSTRPSLAIPRGSFASGEGGYGTDDDRSPSTSVMSRARPGEGNNLFGGRQKIYKIPANPSSRKGSASETPGSTTTGRGTMSGKALYGDDVTQSAFQKLKQKEREQQQMEERDAEESRDSAIYRQNNNNNNNTDTDEAPSSPASRPSFNRASTSATSVDSQSRTSAQGFAPGTTISPTSAVTTPPIKQNPSPVPHPGIERNGTKSKRLYGQGLELNNQPSSAITRLESLNRQRSGANESFLIKRSLSKSATNLNERYQRKSPVYATSNFRPTSPPPSATTSTLGSIESGRRDGGPESIGSNHSYGFIPPLSPPVSETEDQATFTAALQPEDRGKATAMGLFNKPSSKYDEEQYMRRMIQLHEGRNTPPSRRRSPVRVPSGADSTGRPRGLSNTSYLSKADSSASRFSESQDEHNRNEERAAPVGTGIGRSSPAQPSSGTFLADFASDSGSDSETEPSLYTKPSSVSQTSDGIHPAFRTSTESSASGTHNSSIKDSSLDITPEVRLSEPRDLNTIEENEVAEVPLSPIVDKASDKDPDSPTLGPGLGMGGLVRAHLRASVASSIYPSSPAFPPRSGMEGSPPMPPSSGSRMSNGYEGRVHSNPWEYDDLDNAYGPEQPTSAYVHPDISNMSMRAKQMLGQATALRGQENGDENESPRHKLAGVPLPPPEPTWQDELKHGHHRGGSSETQAEREELANELAERRRKVQEKLKNFADSESRSSSPTFGHRFGDSNNHQSPGKTGNAFAMLKNKTPKSGKHDGPQPSKAMKMLGMEGSTHRAASPSPMQTPNGHWRDEEHRMPAHFGRGSRPSSPSPRHQNRPRQPQNRSPPQTSHDERPPSRHGQSGRETPRGRSSSDVSLRAKSMPRYRDDLGPVGEQAEHRSGFPFPETTPRREPSGSVASSARPSTETSDLSHIDNPPSATSGRFRSNSRTAGPAPSPAYFDYDPPTSIQTSHAGFAGLSPRPSPMAPYSANATPPLCETSPATSAMPTPPITPQLAQAASNQPTQSLGTHRRTVDKSQISEPKFVSSTNNTPTVGLPPGASLSNGATPSPPIPPMNPRRRRGTTTQTILGALKVSDRSETPPPPPMPVSAGDAERSMFFDDEKRSRTRQRLRKISSEGGSLNAKARQHLMNSNSSSTPALPQMPNKAPVEGGMF